MNARNPVMPAISINAVKSDEEMQSFVGFLFACLFFVLVCFVFIAIFPKSHEFVL